MATVKRACPTTWLKLAVGDPADPYPLLRHNWERGPGDVCTLHHDLHDLPWPWAGGAFGTVEAGAVADALALNTDAFLGECARVLAPGGRLLLDAADPAPYVAKRAEWRVDEQPAEPGRMAIALVRVG